MTLYRGSMASDVRNGVLGGGPQVPSLESDSRSILFLGTAAEFRLTHPILNAGSPGCQAAGRLRELTSGGSAPGEPFWRKRASATLRRPEAPPRSVSSSDIDDSYGAAKTKRAGLHEQFEYDWIVVSGETAAGRACHLGYDILREHKPGTLNMESPWMNQWDLVLKGCILPDGRGPVDIGIGEGVIGGNGSVCIPTREVRHRGRRKPRRPRIRGCARLPRQDLPRRRGRVSARCLRRRRSPRFGRNRLPGP